MKYRRRSDGEVFTEAQVRSYVKPNNATYQVFLANDPAMWTPDILDIIGFDPIHPTAQAPCDHRFDRCVEGVTYNSTSDRWEQSWSVEKQFNATQERKAMKKAVYMLLEQKRDAGITVNGMRVSTTAAGISRLNGAVEGGKSSRKFVASNGKTYTLTNAQVKALHTAVDNHVQGVYDKAADLLDSIDAATDPRTVDIDSGW